MNCPHSPFDTLVPSAAKSILPSFLPLDLACTTDAGLPDAGLLASQLWQQAVHDLRGKLGVVAAVTALLQKPRSDVRRLELMVVLDRNVAGLRDLLNGVADLARLDAQREYPVICTINMATAMQDMGNNLRIMAASRGLSLDIGGPASLIAQSDPLMVARIAQNLMLNAIQYTRSAGVALTYGLCDVAEFGHWYFDVSDAADALACGDASVAVQAPSSPAAAAGCKGEGIGLSIVGRLCGLLGGTVTVRSVGLGRTTRITLPRRYVGALESLTISTVGGTGLAAAAVAWAPAALQVGQPLRIGVQAAGHLGAPLHA